MDSRHFDLPESRLNVSIFLEWERFTAPSRIEYLLRVASKKKPPAIPSQGALLVEAVPGTGPKKQPLV
jgi:hypothetical protein